MANNQILIHRCGSRVLHYAKIFGNFGREINETLWPAWKMSAQSGSAPLGVIFFGSGPTENFRYICKKKLKKKKRKSSLAVPCLVP